jgi:predicted DCC family thiol-disulfide oxidoreductase YuxK
MASADATASVDAPASGVVDTVVLYDGVCGLCNRFVNFVLPRDRRGRFHFAPLQGPFAAEVLRRHGLTPPAGDPESIVLVESCGTPSERLSNRSTAALRIVARLPGPWSWLGVLRLVPRPLRDWVYDRVANSRYRIFGKLDACPVPSRETRARFLE